jgi:hypothetical protein
MAQINHNPRGKKSLQGEFSLEDAIRRSLYEERDDQARFDELKEVREEFPMYDVGALRRQRQAQLDSIAELERAIKTIHEDIAETDRLIGQCQRRDKKLRELGIEPATN